MRLCGTAWYILLPDTLPYQAQTLMAVAGQLMGSLSSIPPRQSTVTSAHQTHAFVIVTPSSLLRHPNSTFSEALASGLESSHFSGSGTWSVI